MTTAHADKLRVLIVDDEPSIAKLIEHHFSRAGFETETLADGKRAYERLRTSGNLFDIVILDVMLPGMDGMEVCRMLRQERCHVPIILLTARDDEIDRVVGLEIGADDYVTKPFSPRELVARARAVLRRMDSPVEVRPETRPQEAPVSEFLRAGDIEMDLSRHEVRVSGAPVNLTPKEFDLLRYLMENRERVHSRDQLLDHVWGFTALTDTRMVDVHMSHLREKLERDAKTPQYLKTIRGVGYKFSEGAAP